MIDALVTLEILHCALVLFCLIQRRECSEVAALACGLILLSRIKAILTRFEFSYHAEVDASKRARVAL
jgi:hypothetical protein